MKKLIFIRHGKAEDGVPEFSDFERSLTVKGKVISRGMALRLKEKEKDLGVIVSSPAFRALETAIIFSSVYGLPPEKIIIDSNLYFNPDRNSFFEILKKIKEDVDVITLFGHNPSFSELPGFFSNESSKVLAKSGIICLSFNTKTWSEIRPNSGTAEYSLKPTKII
jgi:phosphohistidine phosphatase